ncbi:dUTP diphosphatase [Heyndrickxia sp. FSL W8-0496]|uniref:dUTP diphosphatase n=1 Tax=Heyndrickxia sp. FSL W8-0496 TaxID=2954702 RepID=UPI0030FCBE21
MNLSNLFEIQRTLDYHIMDEHPEIRDQNNLDWKILALQVEIGECANEWRGFKKWSKDKEPRTFIRINCPDCLEKGFTPYNRPAQSEYYCKTCAGYLTIDTNPLLEEYVDGLHFVLSIGLENYSWYNELLPVNQGLRKTDPIKYENTIKQFNYLFETLGYFMDCCLDHEIGTTSEVEEQYENIVRMYLGLGEMLGFSWEQIEQAYMEKNAINHQRQNEGY